MPFFYRLNWKDLPDITLENKSNLWIRFQKRSKEIYNIITKEYKI